MEDVKVETKDERRARVRLWSEDQRVCAVCGFRRINVRHEPDPDHAPEGPDFYRALRNELHEFQEGDGMEGDVSREPERFVVTAWAEPASGPGWANSPVRVVLQEVGGGAMSQEWIQPAQQTARLLTLYRISAEVSRQMALEAAVILKVEHR